MPEPPTIAVTNRSSLVAADEVVVAVAAIQRQLDEHVASRWHAQARLTVRADEGPLDSVWPVVLVDEIRDRFKVGYHDFDDTPFGCVAVRAATARGLPWTVVASHEVIEIATNPWATLCVIADDIGLALEICDPVERSFYEIDGVKVSNFVLPSWFRRSSKGPWDFRGVLTAPLVLHAGGNIASSRFGPWTQADPSAPPLHRSAAGRARP